MDDSDQFASNPAFAPSYSFDSFDPMKRSHEAVGGPEAIKKPRWSPSSSNANSFPAGNVSANNGARNAFDNYGYGPGSHAFANPSPTALYSTPNGMGAGLNGNGVSGQLSLNTSLGMNGLNGATGMNGANGNNNNTLSVGTTQGGQISPSSYVPASPLITNGTLNGAGSNGAYGNMNGFGSYGMNMGALTGMGMGMNMGMGMGAMGGMGFGFGGLASPGAYPMSPAMGNFGQQQTSRLPSGLSINTSNGNFGNNPSAAAVAAAAAAAAANNQTGRTVYIGNLPADASVDELLNLVKFGPLESVRVLPEKSCVFISFLDGATAAAFHADATVKKLSLHNQELKIGWGKASPVPSQVMLSITQSNASRNVYLGGLDENMTEEQLRDDLSRFGLIDQVKIVRDKNIGFVHFLSISTATKVVATLPTEPAWAGKRVNYGKDRCAYVPKNQQGGTGPASAFPTFSPMASNSFNMNGNNNLLTPATPFGGFSTLGVNTSIASAGAYDSPTSPAFMMGMGNTAGASGQNLNRTVYLGNIHPETTTEDLCNAIRGGVLQSIRYLQDKHIAFITFVDPAAAFTFFQVATYQGLTLNNRRLKVGWGKNSGPLSPALQMAVSSGATRNVYIGNIEDFETFLEEKLKRDFGEYGDIELVNFLKEKNCAFVNFTNLSNAIKAIDAVKNKTEYANLRISHGKDRCANPPRSGPQGGGGSRRNQMGPGSALGVTNGGAHEEDANGFEVQMADSELALGAEVDGEERGEIPTNA